MSDESRPLTTSGQRRGCGYRQPGGAYFAVPLAPGGRPVEEFLIDPPVVVEDAARLSLTSVGVAVFEHDGATHVVDIVGREHYPTVAAFVDEARRLGVSRKAPKTIGFAQITAQSRLLLAHAHADIANAAEFPTDAVCPCMLMTTCCPFEGMCARLGWQEPLQGAQHRLALFTSFPIQQIEVMSDKAGGSHIETIRLASKAGVPVFEVAL